MRSDFKRALMAVALAASPCVGLAQSPPPEGVAEPAAAPAAISVGALRRLNDWAVSGTDRPLPGDLWAQSEAATLAALFDRTPAAIASPAGYDLVRRALASSSEAPKGDAAEALRKRFEALGRLGAAEPLSAMTLGGEIGRDPQVQQYGAQADIALGRIDAACDRARGAGEPPTAFLLRLRAFCFARAQQWAAAQFAMDVARENRAAEAWLFSVLPVIAGVETRKPVARYSATLDVAASLAAGLAPPRAPLQNASALAAVALARAGAAPADVRYAAAVRAASQSLIDGKTAREAIRAAIPTAPNARIQPLAAAVRAVEAAPNPVVQGDAVLGALRAATTPAAFYATALVFAPEIEAIPRPAAPQAAPTFARAALALGDPELARSWRAMAPSDTSPETLAALDFAISMAQGDMPAAEAALLKRMAVNAPASAEAAGLEALRGDPVATAPSGAAAPLSELAAALAEASARQARGEVALLAGFGLREGALRLAPADVAAIVSALKAAGLEADARRVLVEIAIGTAAA